jgi:hypothetical protein
MEFQCSVSKAHVRPAEFNCQEEVVWWRCPDCKGWHALPPAEANGPFLEEIRWTTALITGQEKHALPPKFAKLAARLREQPAHIQGLYRYILALTLVNKGQAHIKGMTPDGEQFRCDFETVIGERFTLPRPRISQKQEAALLEVLREMLEG